MTTAAKKSISQRFTHAVIGLFAWIFVMTIVVEIAQSIFPPLGWFVLAAWLYATWLAFRTHFVSVAPRASNARAQVAPDSADLKPQAETQAASVTAEASPENKDRKIRKSPVIARHRVKS